MTLKNKQPNKRCAVMRVDVRCRGDVGGLSSPLLYSLHPLLSYRLDFLFSFSEADESSAHTMESLISEPSLTRGRGLVGEYSTWLSLALSGRRSDASEKLLLLSGDDSWVGVLQM